MRAVAIMALLLVGGSASSAAAPEASRPVPGKYPFAAGEAFKYSAKLGVLSLGTASMSVAGVDTVRGIEAFVFRFGLEGGTFFFKLNNVMQSWVATEEFVSLRFHQDNDEDGKLYHRHYEIYPDSGFYRQENREGTLEAPSRPLDDAAFFYFIRTTPLEPGHKYEYARYFRKELNPVVVTVTKREKMELPDGNKVDCLVLEPIVGDRGIFGPRAEARLWLTDDTHRVPVQIRSRLPFGTVTLRLTEMTLVEPSAAPTGH